MKDFVSTQVPPKKTPPPTKEAPKGPKRTTGIKKALLPEAIVKRAKKAIGNLKDEAIFQAGVDAVNSGEINPFDLVNEINATPRSLSPLETMALLYYRTYLNTLTDSAHDKIIEAIESGGGLAKDSAQAQLNHLKERKDNLDYALSASGSIQGQSFRLRQLMADDEYNVHICCGL